MNIEEMKKAWEQTDMRLSSLEAETSRLAQSASRRRHTVFDNLRNRYRRFSIVASTMVCVMVLYAVAELWPGPYSVWISLAMSIYFIVVSVMDYSIYRRLSEIDIDTMSVSEVTRTVISCRRRHLQFMAVLIPSCILLLGILVWQAFDDEYMLLGMCAGAIVGVIIGIRSYRRFMADYRFLIDD